MTKTSDVPMPNTAHPGLEEYAEAVRNSTVDPVLIPRVTDLRAEWAAWDEAMAPTAISPKPMILSKHKAAGGAPFVGDPVLNDARYYWWVWADEAGRYITSDAELVWRFDPTPPKRTHHINLRLQS
jgi:hypothetical protein